MPADASRFREGIVRWAEAVAGGWSEELLGALQEAAPVAAPTGDPRQRPPGTLRDAIRVEPGGFTGTAFSFRMVAPGIEARTTAKGAAPHIIRPRTAGVLAFYSGGQVRFAREVFHPGNVGTDWFQNGLRARGQVALLAAAGRARFG